jgi:hypothetical protein
VCEAVGAFSGEQEPQRQSAGSAQAFSRRQQDLQGSVLAAKLSAYDRMAAAAVPGPATTATQLLALALAGHNAAGANSSGTTASALHALELLQLLQRIGASDTAAPAAGCALLPAAAGNLTAGAGAAAGAAAPCRAENTTGISSAPSSSPSSPSNSSSLEGIDTSDLERLVRGCFGALDPDSRVLYQLLTDQPMTAAQLQVAVQVLVARIAAGQQRLAAQLVEEAAAAAAQGSSLLQAQLAAAGAAASGDLGAGGGGGSRLDGEVVGALLQRLLQARFPAYPSRSGCCRPGSGAFEQGCSLPAA